MKTIKKTVSIILLLLAITFIDSSCNKDNNDDNPENVDNGYYLTAKVQNTEHNFDFISTGPVLMTKVGVGGLTKIALTAHNTDDSSLGFQIGITVNQHFNNAPQNITQDVSIVKEEVGDDYVWGDTSIWNNFSLIYNATNETATYIEGTFSFIGKHINSNTGLVDSTINITEGKFKAKKEGF